MHSNSQNDFIVYAETKKAAMQNAVFRLLLSGISTTKVSWNVSPLCGHSWNYNYMTTCILCIMAFLPQCHVGIEQIASKCQILATLYTY